MFITSLKLLIASFLILSVVGRLDRIRRPFELHDSDFFDPDSPVNKIHLKEDLEGVIDANVNEMRPEDMRFHYFREHDTNNDNMLDGNELLTSILHHHDNEDHYDVTTRLKDAVTFVDRVLRKDTDGDGMLSFQEYVQL